MKILKTAFSIALAFALAVGLAAGLAACNRESQPKTGDLSSNPGSGGMSSKVGKAENIAGDAAMTAKIKVELLKTSELKSTDISVDTKDGQVTLTGTVPDAPQVERAAKVAGAVEGVRNVDNKLTVKSAS